MGAAVEVRVGARQVHGARFVRTFAEADRGELIVYEDSSGRLALAVSHGSAVDRLELGDGELVTIGVLSAISEA